MKPKEQYDARRAEYRRTHPKMTDWQIAVRVFAAVLMIGLIL